MRQFAVRLTMRNFQLAGSINWNGGVVALVVAASKPAYLDQLEFVPLVNAHLVNAHDEEVGDP